MANLVDNISNPETMAHTPTFAPVPQKIYSAIPTPSISNKRRSTSKRPYLISLCATIGTEVRKEYIRQARIEKRLFLRRRAFVQRRRKELATGKKILFHKVRTAYGSVTVSTDPKLAADSLRSIFSEKDPRIIKEKILVRNILKDPKTPRHKIYARLLKWKGYEEEARIEEEKMRDAILAKGGAQAKRLRDQMLHAQNQKLLEEKIAVDVENPPLPKETSKKKAVRADSDDDFLELPAKVDSTTPFPNKISALMMKKGKRYKTMSIIDKSNKMLSSGFYKANPILYTEMSLGRYLPLLMTKQVSTSRVKKKVEIRNLSEDQSMAKVSRWVLESAEKTNRGVPNKRASLLAQEIIASKHDRNAFVKKRRDALYAEVWPQLDWAASDVEPTPSSPSVNKKSSTTPSSPVKKG
jgi:ribosomal protein S7